jgi:hypothetical protein
VVGLFSVQLSNPSAERRAECQNNAGPSHPFPASCIVPPLRIPFGQGGHQGGINVVQYIQTMMRKEPITLLVMCLMIAILIFGLWDILHVVKR